MDIFSIKEGKSRTFGLYGKILAFSNKNFFNFEFFLILLFEFVCPLKLSQFVEGD